MVEISHGVCIKFGDGKKVQIPDSLVLKELGVCHLHAHDKTSVPPQPTANPVQDPDGIDYLKLSSTSHIINRLICGCSKKMHPSVEVASSKS